LAHTGSVAPLDASKRHWHIAKFVRQECAVQRMPYLQLATLEGAGCA
jgi:hypothetical protein